MKFLIATEPDDNHAASVNMALNELGHEVKLFFTADQPTQQKNSISLENYKLNWSSSDSYHSCSEQNYDVVWWRRPRKPYIPKDAVHADDYQFVARENNLFFESLASILAPTAWWINSKEAANKANSKILQLKLAAQCGLTIPITLFSNNANDIRCFLQKYKQETVICKSFCSSFWFEKERVKVAYTAKVDERNLPDDETLQMSPSIFQVEVKKKYELRITCFGDYIVAAKLNSQQHPEGQIDWRAIPFQEMEVEPYQLPADIEIKIRLLMRRLGIVFGCFDFIVTPDNNYYFLEVNEQGQFLWVEGYNPDIKMLDIFIQFLLNQSRTYRWDASKFSHSIDKYEKEIQALIMQNVERHVDLNKKEVERSI